MGSEVSATASGLGAHPMRATTPKTVARGAAIARFWKKGSGFLLVVVESSLDLFKLALQALLMDPPMEPKIPNEISEPPLTTQ